MKNRDFDKQELIIYENKESQLKIDTHFDGENFWLNRQQLAELFGRDVKTIGKHVNNALKEELSGFSVVAKFATTARDGKTYQVDYYNLDMILSVGYRVKSTEGVHFRRWANTVLKSHLTKGYSVNEKKLADLNLALQILERSDIPELSGTASLIADYTQALFLLDSYDRKELPEVDGNVDTWKLTYEEARGFLESLPDFKKSDLFAKERTGQFHGILEQIYAGFGETEFYPTVEKKAANLLYFVVKDHPFYDGNKRSAAALFVYFLYKNQALHNINNSTLAAIVLMVALSKPDERENMTLLIENFLESE
ncbi:MAG: virulence RhuM family protein [Streptococcaceae bacterium]|jgi:prophage maintenance system killer protein|nr:virulence RhuM family protein [Streptococcaceae bacterium]